MTATRVRQVPVDAAQDEGSPDEWDAVPDAPDASDGGCPPVAHSGSLATSFQINPSHNGVQPLDRLTLPLCKRWIVPLEGPGITVAANGRVFVATTNTVGANANALYALDALTGAKLWGPIPLGGFPLGADAGEKPSWSALAS